VIVRRHGPMVLGVTPPTEGPSGRPSAVARPGPHFPHQGLGLAE
jgi:hypothetical protein